MINMGVLNRETNYRQYRIISDYITDYVNKYYSYDMSNYKRIKCHYMCPNPRKSGPYVYVKYFYSGRRYIYYRVVIILQDLCVS